MGLAVDTTYPSSDAKLLEFVVNEGNGVKGLADSNIASLPPRYVHPLEERIDRTDVIDASPYLGAPIDMSGLEGAKKDAVVEALCWAAEKLGFFQVVNHGVPLEVLERAKQAAHTFFNLPSEKKAVFLKGKTPCPNVFYGTSFAPETEKKLEWKDYLSMIYMNDEEAMQFWPQECRCAILLPFLPLVSVIVITIPISITIKIDTDKFLFGLDIGSNCVLPSIPPCLVGNGIDMDLLFY